MGLAFLAPLFLAGLAALAVPILVHLSDRDQRDVVRFASLRFLTRLPYRRRRQQRIRHWLLFLLRALAITLLCLAFARPWLPGSDFLVAGDEDPGRELVIALDVSYSMAYGDTWERAVAAARDAAGRVTPNGRVTLLTFAEQAALTVPPTGDPARVFAALDGLAPGAGGTRFAAALQSANQVLVESPYEDREVVLISDFQARGWERSTRTQLAAPARLTPVVLAADDAANVLIAGVETQRQEDDGRGALHLAVRLVNPGDRPVSELPVTVDVQGRELATGRVNLQPSDSATVRLGPIAEPLELTRATVRIGDDRLPPDNTFHLTLAPRPALPVLLVTARGARDTASIYLREALAVAEQPSFEVRYRRVDRVRAEDLADVAVVILDDSPLPAGDAGQAVLDRVAEGAGLWLIVGRRAPAWDADLGTLLPATWGAPVDRLNEQGVSLVELDDDHPAFAIFSRRGRGGAAGHVAGARFYRYRPLTLADGAKAIARFTDGGVALAEGAWGKGRVLVWGSALDNRWSSLPVHPAFAPLVHQLGRHLGGERVTDGWREVGQVLDLAATLPELGLEPPVVVEAPSGRRHVAFDGERPGAGDGGDTAFLRLEEAGFYDIYPLGEERAAHPVAVNVDRAESDLAGLDVEAFVAASTAASPAATGSATLSDAERERRQDVGWHLVLGALVLLAAESLWSNRQAQEQPGLSRSPAHAE